MFAKRKRRSLSVTDDANSTISNNQTESDDDAIEMVQVFVSINETFEFPKCRRQCLQFYVGRLDFEAVNASVEVRAGDIAEFSCKTGYYIDAPEPVPTYLPTLYSVILRIARNFLETRENIKISTHPFYHINLD